MGRLCCLNGWMDRRAGRRTDGERDGWMDGRVDGWTDGRTERRAGGHTDGRTDRALRMLSEQPGLVDGW